MEFNDVIRKRFSVRKFRDKKVEPEKIEQILEAGRLAPTAKNIQPIRIYVVESKEGLEKIDKASRCRYQAPTVLMICGIEKDAFKREEHSVYEMDASIVCTHMMLEATNLGVDNIWIELFDEQTLREEFSLPQEIRPVCLLPIGYKSEDFLPGPMHAVRKPLEELVEYR